MAIELIHQKTRLVVETDVGPRLSWFGKVRGENFLYWDPDQREQRGDWRLRGGHRLWTTRPGADETEETYAPDNVECRVRRRRDGLYATAPPTRDGIVKTLIALPVASGWRIRHRIQNVGDMLWSGGIWALTCTRPVRTTRYYIPVDGGHRTWDLLTVVIPRRWGGAHTSRIDDPQLSLREDGLHARATGREAKRMMFTARGELSMIDRARGTFTKSSRVIDGASYPQGANVACYLAPRAFMVELETMSPLVTLIPGATLVHDELWSLR